MSDPDGCVSGWDNPACYFYVVWVPGRGGECGGDGSALVS